MTALVTGGTGFVGKCMVETLLKQGHRVQVLTRDKRKADFSLSGRVETFELDISRPFPRETLDLLDADVDVLIHLAASVNFYGDKRQLFKANVEATRNLLDFIYKRNIKKFIFASSIEAMGPIAVSDIPADEESACRPICSYGLSKLMAEEIVKDFAATKNIDACILRLGNVYGPGGPSFVIPIANALLTKNNIFRFLPVYRHIYLHPVYNEDVAEGIIKIAQREKLEGTYILAGEDYATVGTLFELIAQALNVNIEINRLKEKSSDRAYLALRAKLGKIFKSPSFITYLLSGESGWLHRAYSIAKAKHALGYMPRVNLEEGIAKTIRWAMDENIIGRG